MLLIHHLGVSQSERVVWLMEELGLPYEIIWHRRGADGLAPASYLALHPAATAPVVQDGDRTLCESAAILEYVCHKYAGGRLTVSPDQPNFSDYVYWMHFNNNILGLFFTRLALGRQTEGPIAGFVRRREDGYARMLDADARRIALPCRSRTHMRRHHGDVLSHIAANARRPRRPSKCAILCRARLQAARLHQSDADCRTHGRTA